MQRIPEKLSGGDTSLGICKMLECSFYIPVRRDVNLSDGQPHDTRSWDWLDNELFVRFGGATVAPGMYKGFYEDPDTGKRVDDGAHKFMVAVDDSQVDKLRSLLAAACVLFQQKCVFLSVAGHVEFIEAPKNDSG